MDKFKRANLVITDLVTDEKLQGWKYEWQPVGKGASVDLKNRIIKVPAFGLLSAEDEELVRGLNYHESAHIAYTAKAIQDIPEAVKSSKFKNILNVLEDLRIEYIASQKIAGAAVSLKRVNDMIIQKIKERGQEIGGLNGALLKLSIENNGISSNGLKFDSEAIEIYEQIKDKFNSWKEISGLEDKEKGFDGVLQLTREIYEIIKQREEERQEKGDGQNGDGGKGKSGEKQELDDDNNENNSSSNNDTDSKDENEIEDGMKREQKGGKEKTGKGAKKQDDGEKEGKKSGSSKKKEEEVDDENILDKMREELGGELSKKSYENFEELKTPYVADKSKDEFKKAKEDSDNFFKYRSQITSEVGKLSRYLEQALLTVTKARINPNQEGGKLDVRKLHRIPKAIDKKVFKKIKKGIKLDTAISIVLDESGSMEGSKMYATSILVIALAESLNKLNIPFEVIGFSTTEWGGSLPKGMTRTNPILGTIYKEFNERYGAVRTRFGNIYAKKHNVDGENLEYAYRRLRLRKEKRKMILVLSDGLPEAGHDNDDIMGRHLKDMCRIIRSKGVEIYGFGILMDAPKEYYGKENFILFENVNKMGTQFYRRLIEIMGIKKSRVNKE